MENSIINRFNAILQASDNSNKVELIDVCSEYGEIGYTLSEGKKGIIFSDWNRFDKYPNIMEFLEENYEIEWNDEWLIDYDNSKCYRSIHDSYGWQPSMYCNTNGEIISYDCINDMNEEEFKEFLIEINILNNPKTAFNLRFFKSKGELYGEEESHMFESESDPEQRFEILKEKYPEKDFYFNISSVEQFGLSFEIYCI